MFKFLRKMKGQSTLEYAVLIVIVIGALLSIQVYIKRGISGRLKQAADDIGDQFSTGNTNVRTVTIVTGNTREKFGIDGIGVSNTQMLMDEVTDTKTNWEILNAEFEYWGK